ncbi:MAG: hypothetical protein NTX61_01725 [Bacteroidetes bacterium]|nr:hypothetical protein [Bacteroidota bacterium]
MKKFSLIILLSAIISFSFANDNKVVPDSAILQQLSSLKKVITDRIANDSVKNNAKNIVIHKPVVTGVRSIRGFFKNQLAVYGNAIEIKFDNLKDIYKLQKLAGDDVKGSLDTNIILFLEQQPVKDIHAGLIDTSGNTIVFNLDRDSKSLQQFNPYFEYIWSSNKWKFSAGFRNGQMFGYSRSYASSYTNVWYVSPWALLGVLVLFGFIIGCFLYLSKKRDLIRCGDMESQFSLGLTQLCFWTLLISSSYFFICIINNELQPLSASTLILLGVSIVTTAGSKMITVREKIPISAYKPSQGFFKDLLSDEVGYSVHRSQFVLWTIIMGIYFIEQVVTRMKMPDFPETLLALMGISSAGYVGLKNFEYTPANAGSGKSTLPGQEPTPVPPVPTK